MPAACVAARTLRRAQAELGVGVGIVLRTVLAAAWFLFKTLVRFYWQYLKVALPLTIAFLLDRRARRIRRREEQLVADCHRVDAFVLAYLRDRAAPDHPQRQPWVRMDALRDHIRDELYRDQCCYFEQRVWPTVARKCIGRNACIKNCDQVQADGNWVEVWKWSL